MCLCAEEITEVWQTQGTETASEIGVCSENMQTSRILSFLCVTAKDDGIYCWVIKALVVHSFPVHYGVH